MCDTEVFIRDAAKDTLPKRREQKVLIRQDAYQKLEKWILLLESKLESVKRLGSLSLLLSLLCCF